MVRLPRRTHSVSGPPSAHVVMKDVACCCNLAKMRDFYMTIMALRKNPQRPCKKELPALPLESAEHATTRVRIFEELDTSEYEPRPKKARTTTRPVSKPAKPPQPQSQPSKPFRFFDLPREVRDHIYSYLVVQPGQTPLLSSKVILKNQKKRATTQRTRERLNIRRIQSGKRPITPRERVAEPILHLDILQASKLLHYEASDSLYQTNVFAISLDSFPSITLEVPYGWNFSRITKMQLELQLKDAQRMNSYIDWATFFATFPVLRSLRIIPTFHSRYYDWALTELNNWSSAHFIHKAFFRELLAAIPDSIDLRLGIEGKKAGRGMAELGLLGKQPVSKRVLRDMYCDLGMRRDVHGKWICVDRVIDFGVVTTMDHDS